MYLGKTIKSRLLIVNLVVAFLIIGIITGFFYLRTIERSREEKSNIVLLELEKTIAYIEREFSKIYETTQSLQLTAYTLIENPSSGDRDMLISLSEKIIDENNNLIGVSFAFEPNIIENDALFAGQEGYQSDGQFITYVTKQYNELNVSYVENYQDFELYYRAYQEKETFFTEPYIFNVEGKEIYITTVVFPLTENGEFIGLVGIDFSSEYILGKVEKIESVYDRRDIIVSQNGIIVTNTKDENDFGNHISTIDSDYLDKLADVDVDGHRISEMKGNDNLQIIHTLDLGSSGESWYIFSDIPVSVLMQSINQDALLTIYIGIGLFIIYAAILLFINNSVIYPIVELTETVTEFDVENDDIDALNIDPKKLTDINALISSIKLFISETKDNVLTQNKRAELREKHINLQNIIDNASSKQVLFKNILKLICDESNSLLGAMYISNDTGYNLESTYGVKMNLQKHYNLTDGIIPEVARELSPKMLTHNDIQLPIDIGVDDVNAAYILVYPIKLGKTSKVVFLIASLEPITETSMEFIKNIEKATSFGIEKRIDLEEIENLYEQTKEQASILEEQQEELRVANEELQNQQEELRVTNEELETQQEELRVANQELELNLDEIDKMNKELEKTQSQLQIRTFEAERSNQFKSEFLANMSHELRTPLNSILILSNLIKDNQSKPEKLLEYADTIHSAGHDLLELINGILDLSKVEAGHENITIKQWDVSKGLNELHKRIEHIATEKNIKLVFDIPKEDVTIETDPDKVIAIIQNLLSNAVKFTKKGQVKLTFQNNTDDVQFSVIDTGIGIKPENLELIFEEFKQVENDNKRSYGGTGLGLAICQRYAKLLNGRIHVESVVNQGSKFILILPKNKPIKEAKKVSKPISRPKNEKNLEEGIVADDRHQISPRDNIVLIIDDDINTLKSLRDYFNQKGIFVIVSDTGENGLFLADYYMPSMIILDYKLPKISGKDVISKLINNPRTKQSKIVLISGTKVPKDINVDFIKKPLNQNKLDNLFSMIPKNTGKIYDILFVEDDQLHLRNMVEYIQSKNIDHKYRIDTAESKKETLNKISKKHYALLVMDLSLSDTSNFDLVKEIKEKPTYRNVPIIVYTGKRFTSSEESELRTYVDDIIIKAGKSPERLLEDIELFIKSHDENIITTDSQLFESKSILVVDDDIRNIFALTGLLEGYGINVIYDTSGLDTLERLKEKPDIDLILMDIMMPELDGYETTKEIRKISKYKDIPIVALTARTMRGDREKCIASGATEYLSKPLNKDKLLSVLRIWLQ